MLHALANLGDDDVRDISPERLHTFHSAPARVIDPHPERGRQIDEFAEPIE